MFKYKKITAGTLKGISITQNVALIQATLQKTRVDYHTPNLLIIQFHSSSVWKKCLSCNSHILKLYYRQSFSSYFEVAPGKKYIFFSTSKRSLNSNNFFYFSNFLCTQRILDTQIYIFFNLKTKFELK